MATPRADPLERLAELKLEAARDFAALAAERARPSRPRRRPDRPVGIGPALRIVAVVVLLLLPFAVLVRGSVVLYSRYRFPSWLALTVAGGATLLVVAAYGAWLARRLTARARFTMIATWVALPLVLGFALRGLLYLSRANAKTDVVRAEYRATHPTRGDGGSPARGAAG